MSPLKEFDQRLAVMAQSIPIIIMPGATDPSNLSLPQAPIKAGLLPSSAKFKTLHLVGNPSWTTIDGTKILMSSGQNVDDMIRYSHGRDRLKVAEISLKCRHIAPSAPDTICKLLSFSLFKLIGCYPFFDQDPFIIEGSPHCYVIGNQPAFATAIVNGIREFGVFMAIR